MLSVQDWQICKVEGICIGIKLFALEHHQCTISRDNFILIGSAKLFFAANINLHDSWHSPSSLCAWDFSKAGV